MQNERIEITHSKGSMVSYGFGKFINEFFNMAFGAYVFFFYESEIGLNSWYTSIGFIIFALYNAINDPLIGYLTDRPFKFTKKWGRRFPWVFIGGVPWILSYILIFTPPMMGEFWIFIWLVVMTCLYDTFASIFNVSFYSIFPDKFRSVSERRLASTLATLIGVLGVALGAIIPPMFIVWEDLRSYVIQAVVVIITLMIALLLLIPGAKEDQERIDCYLESCEEGLEREPFFKSLIACLKHKNFLSYTISYTLYQSLVALIIGSIAYVAQFVLTVPATDITLLSAGFLLGALISMPVWAKYADKINDDRKTMIIASCCLTIATGILFFINDYWILFFGMFVWGVMEGGFWVMMGPILATIIDESIVKSGKRKEGIYNGVQTFMSRAALVIQALSFTIIHEITGFVENAPTQTALAQFGIQIHFTIIPMILMLISTIVFWKFYKLTPDKVGEIKSKLIELNI